MVNDKVDAATLSVANRGDERTNERSSIVFPYADLDTAVEVAKALYARAGRGACELDGLAAELNQTVSGAFRIKTGATKIFGLTEKEGRDQARLTQLGIRIINSDEEKNARVEAFLHVPLYSAIFDLYRGVLLPPSKALEKEMVTLGVSPKIADRARQIFERSARQAGFFEFGENRLVRPKSDAASQQTTLNETQQENSKSGSTQVREKDTNSKDNYENQSLHPFIQGLLKTLPATDSPWPVKERVKWLTLASNAFDLIYQGEGRIEIRMGSDPI